MSPSGRRSGVAFALVPLSPLLFIGLLSVVYGGAVAIGEWRFLNRAAQARGTVIAFDKWAKGDYPIVRYQAPSGASVQFKSRIRRSRDYYRIDQAVGVLYDPAEPGRAEIDSSDARIAPLMTLIFGVLIIGFCLACIFAVYLWTRLRSAPAE